MLYRDYPKLVDILFETNGSYEYSSTDKAPITLKIKSLGNTKSFTFDVDLVNSYSRLEADTHQTFNVSMKNNPSNNDLGAGYLSY